ncbi:ComF family protein [Dysgonomonas sp. Marseille-P4677]|uniref:ComF family protein n=1 Tax=Dysgonomonas sp. Marseille-P4677 TaxID=2364790 RepID=UPI001912EF7C|nr:phosphoribosyltransferase family protein [Dysgonomonas sp. Marseille-P4677]MBK5721046.1 ComF family protein [Dysgonomonas sp. Marseille-P4677]
MKTIVHNFLNLFFPDLCVVCNNRLTEGEQHICTDCLLLLPKTNFHLQADNRLEQFFAGRIPFRHVAAYAYFVKGGSIQSIIHELKYKRNPRIAYFIGELCGENMKGSQFIADIDLLVPVPLHPKREKDRGYNQSLEICKGISSVTGVSIDNRTLIRKVNNRSQTKNARFDRWKNVEDIFDLTNNEAFAGKHVLLVDDVITTGSTLESCAKEILKCEGTEISIYSVGTAG